MLLSDVNNKKDAGESLGWGQGKTRFVVAGILSSTLEWKSRGILLLSSWITGSRE
jgi:hypothetical protein